MLILFHFFNFLFFHLLYFFGFLFWWVFFYFNFFIFFGGFLFIFFLLFLCLLFHRSLHRNLFLLRNALLPLSFLKNKLWLLWFVIWLIFILNITRPFVLLTILYLFCGTVFSWTSFLEWSRITSNRTSFILNIFCEISPIFDIIYKTKDPCSDTRNMGEVTKIKFGEKESGVAWDLEGAHFLTWDRDDLDIDWGVLGANGFGNVLS